MPDIFPTNAPTRILLVEDQFQIRDTLQRVLRFHGYDVAVAGCKPEAEAFILQNQIDLLLTDVALPSLGTGFELAQWTRERLPRLPIIVISGLALSAPPDWLLADPAVRLLPKPFLIADLLGAITLGMVA